jgi:membrane fusion protein, heavy metal efflux system
MPINEHGPTARGRVFLWGGAALGLLFLALVWSGGFGLLSGGKEQHAAPDLMVRQGDKITVPEGSALRNRLSVMPAGLQSIGAKLVLPGVVESDPARTASILTPLSGRVIALKVGLGDRVAQGQVLAIVDSADLGQAYDDDDKAADSARLTQKNLERQEAQNKIGVASDRDLDQARSDHAQAAAEYTRTQARLKTLGIALGDRSSRLLSVTAPVAGSVTTLSVAAGSMINDPTQPIMSVADLSTVWVTALVPEKNVAEVSKNQDADITLIAYPDRTLHGKVLFVSAVIEPDSRRNKIRIAFANADYALKPNMFATVTLT